MNLHPVQKGILLKLASLEDGLMKFSELQPDNIENDLFNYHLQYLVKEGMISKQINGYHITNKGVEAILLTDSQGTEYDGIRASVIVFVVDRNQEKKVILTQKRNRKPYIGEINPGISGKINLGESIVDAAQRKLHEETGLIGKCKSIGVLRKIRHIKNTKVVDDGFYYVCVCEDFTGKLIESNEFGENFWMDFDQALSIQKNVASSSEFSFKVLEKILKGDYVNFLFEENIYLENL